MNEAEVIPLCRAMNTSKNSEPKVDKWFYLWHSPVPEPWLCNPTSIMSVSEVKKDTKKGQEIWPQHVSDKCAVQQGQNLPIPHTDFS